MLSINTNTSALMAQNNLNQTQNSLSASMERLSTGLRINSASDDAAGLQISNRMKTQTNGMDVAMRNANDAISMAQTAEGAMVETTNMLNRMRDLSLQAANGSNTGEDRAAMQEEVTQLISQIDDTARQTNFAGINLLDGSASSLSFQVGADAGETISFGIDSAFAKDLGSDVQVSSAVATAGGKLAADLTLGDGTADELVIKQDSTTKEVAEQMNKFLSAKNVDVTAVAKEDGSGVELVGTAAALDAAKAADSDLPDKAGATPTSVSGINISTAEGAQKAAVVLDSALAKIDSSRADLGAVQNRLDYTVANLQNTQENLNTSMSRIKDVDFAKETTNMTKN
ncbi:flagellin N-terminal helical domain-containing protein, partial [Spongorhabdus nitratireducens]